MRFENDEVFLKLKNDIEINNGEMRDAWIIYKGEKWHPVIMTDSKSKVRGFEVNFSGDWGANDVVGRKKLPLIEFLEGIAQGKFPTNAAVRCKRVKDSQRNGRNLGDIQFTGRLNELITRIRNVESSAAKLPVEVSSENCKDKEIANGGVTHSQTNVSEDDQRVLEADTGSLSTSEREAVVKVRFGQGAFRSSLLEIAGDVCWMSGIEGKELLIASHIQPWAHCEKNPDARGCPDNGLLLSSLWDAAFDSGLLTFDEKWKVVTSSLLSDSAKRHLGLEEERFLPEGFRNLRRAQYLAYHRAVVFKQ